MLHAPRLTSCHHFHFLRDAVFCSIWREGREACAVHERILPPAGSFLGVCEIDAGLNGTEIKQEAEKIAVVIKCTETLEQLNANLWHLVSPDEETKTEKAPHCSFNWRKLVLLLKTL